MILVKIRSIYEMSVSFTLKSGKIVTIFGKNTSEYRLYRDTVILEHEWTEIEINNKGNLLLKNKLIYLVAEKKSLTQPSEPEKEEMKQKSEELGIEKLNPAEKPVKKNKK